MEAYVDIRSKDKQRSVENKSRVTTTARQLLSVLRLAEAHCKLDFRSTVQQSDVDEAIRLIQMSKASVMESDSDLARGVKSDPVSRIWNLVCPKLNSGYSAWLPVVPSSVSRARAFKKLLTPPATPLAFSLPRTRAVAYEEASNIALRSGLTQEDFERFIQDYEGLNVIQVNASRTRIDLVTSGFL